MSQFTHEPNSRWDSLAKFIPISGVYATGRLDADSEGLLVLTANGHLQARLSQPQWKHWRTYHVQVEGEASETQLESLRNGVYIRNHLTQQAKARLLEFPSWSPRIPAIRTRLSVPTSWIELSLREGRNRQVRRMTAAVGLPTLRLIRFSIDLLDGESALDLSGLNPGQWRYVTLKEEQRLKKLLAQHKTSASCRTVESWPK